MGKPKTGSCVHREVSDEPKQRITRYTIEDAKKTIKVGQQFEYYKRSKYAVAETHKGAELVTGRVVEIYNDFFTVEADSNGTREAIKWIDLILAKRKGGRLII